MLNQYQRRTDLIPNLVETVKGYATQEQDTFVKVTEARAKATQMTIPADVLTNPQAFHEFEQNQAQLGGALGRLLAVSENYPDLKSDQNFLVLQSQLEGTENRIAVARNDYNEAVRDYNTTLHTFPGVFWAGTLYHAEKPMTPFQAADTAQAAPKVNFDIAPPGQASSATALKPGSNYVDRKSVV